MRVQFTATFDELVDATVRVVKRVRKTGRRDRLVGWAVVTLATGLGAAFIPVNRPDWAFGVLVAGFCGFFYALLVFPITRQVRYAVKQSVESGAPFEVVVELKPDGISFHQKNSHTVHEWAIVEEIEEDRGDIVFHIKHGNILVVRARAFESAEARRQFVELANQLRSGSRTPLTRRTGEAE
jgi:hypothetical protein